MQWVWLELQPHSKTPLLTQCHDANQKSPSLELTLSTSSVSCIAFALCEVQSQRGQACP